MRGEDRDTADMLEPVLLGRAGTWVLIKYRRAWTKERYCRWLSEHEMAHVFFKELS